MLSGLFPALLGVMTAVALVLVPAPSGTPDGPAAETFLALVSLPVQAAAKPHHAQRPHHRTTSFRIGTFNVLGSQHTVRPGGWGPGRVRARVTARVLKRRGLDVVGMQEVQADQLQVLRGRMPGYRFWPGTALGYPGVPLQIGWRADKFTKLRSGSVTVPFDGQHRPVPWVLLRSRASGKAVYVVDIHNSAGRQERSRDRATRREIKLVRHLRSHRRPVFVLGDMNEKREWFCKVVRRTDLWSANGGSVRHGRCHPPRHTRIDWVMGSGRIRFSQYRHDKGFGVRFSSDHDLVRARVTIRVGNGRHHAHPHRHGHHAHGHRSHHRKHQAKHHRKHHAKHHHQHRRHRR